ncbi:sigma-70 family RNA polymerase sigma factor [Novosphingobium sp. 9]|uniref:sigma-70 family RNA polymerase sigma factor n=1 Tax=Novosphingobium sp. 9 TaxID=2025349 RepID=UPI0021B60D57|nr:sigma-70 family RNA polymerase sigma factor [Novosphingobium sp. 9]
MGDTRAKLDWYKSVILPHQAALRSRLVRIVTGGQDADDMVAEVLCRAWTVIEWERVIHGRAYLYNIARNLVIDEARRNKVVSFEQIADAELLQADTSLEGQLQARSELRWLHNFLPELPIQARRAFHMRRVQEKSVAEIAEVMGLSVSTVEKHLAKALALIMQARRQREEFGGEPTGSGRTERAEIEETAARHAVRYPDADDHERAEIMAWVDENPFHAVAYAQAESAWQDAERLKALGPRFDDAAKRRDVPADLVEPDDFPVTDSDVRPGRSSRRGVILSGVAVAALLGAWPARHLFGPRGERIETRFGEVRTLQLDDGSTLHLNTDSAVEVAFTGDRRFLRLLRGEGTFDVAHDPDRPFEVETGDSITRAIGTSFTLRRQSDRVDLTVTEGVVSVRDASRYAQVPAGSGARIVDGAAIVPARLTSLEIAQRTSWQDRMLVFDGLTIGEAAAQFNRYRAKPLRVNDPAVAQMRIGGRFGLNESDVFLDALQSGFGVNITREADGSVEIGT